MKATTALAALAVFRLAQLGAPYTGFGAMGTVGGVAGAKSFTIASNKQGTDVDSGQFVLKTNTNALFNGTILTNQGTNQTFANFPIGVPEPATFCLMGLALAGGAGFIRRRS